MLNQFNFKAMKKMMLLALLISVFTIANAQEPDTTRIKMGNKKITIISKNQGEKGLNTGRENFEKELKALEDSLKNFENKMSQMREQGNNDEIIILEKETEEIKKQIEALNKGIEDIKIQIENDFDVDNEFEHEIDIDDDHHDRKEEKKKRKSRFEGHWAGFEVGINSFMNPDYTFTLPTDGKFLELNTGKSWNFNLNFFEQNIPIHPKYFGFVTGLGVNWNVYSFNQDIKLVKDATGYMTGEEVTDTDFNKNTLRTIYLTAPLIFEIQIPTNKRDKRMYFGAGLTGSMKISARTKQEVDEHSPKIEHKSDFNLASYRYGVTARLGYGALRLFANYDLVPLFKKNLGPEVYPFSAGLVLLNF
ncbi:MAG TPA: hypothetical protein DCQ31_07295 [Bacteroidales bacterium]|nr:hypothetical protein [Bacteroidales bacterium]